MNNNDDSFFAGVCVGLAVLAAADQETLWWEVVNMVGYKKLYAHARRQESLEWAGFARYKQIAL